MFSDFVGFDCISRGKNPEAAFEDLLRRSFHTIVRFVLMLGYKLTSIISSPVLSLGKLATIDVIIRL